MLSRTLERVDRLDLNALLGAEGQPMDRLSILQRTVDKASDKHTVQKHIIQFLLEAYYQLFADEMTDFKLSQGIRDKTYCIVISNPYRPHELHILIQISDEDNSYVFTGLKAHVQVQEIRRIAGQTVLEQILKDPPAGTFKTMAELLGSINSKKIQKLTKSETPVERKALRLKC